MKVSDTHQRTGGSPVCTGKSKGAEVAGLRAGEEVLSGVVGMGGWGADFQSHLKGSFKW